jgi:hypothetical protein
MALTDSITTASGAQKAQQMILATAQGMEIQDQGKKNGDTDGDGQNDATQNPAHRPQGKATARLAATQPGAVGNIGTMRPATLEGSTRQDGYSQHRRGGKRFCVTPPAA